MDTSGILLQMIYLFLIIVVGFGASKLGFINEETNTNISRLLAFVTGPLQILSSVLKPGNHPIKNSTVLVLTLLSVVLGFAMIFVSKLLPLILRGETAQNNCFRFMFIISNISYMGYPIIDSIFGNEYRFYATIFVLTFNILSWTYGVSLMSGEKLKFTKDVILRPMVIAAIAAFILYFTKIGMRCPEILYRAVSGVGDTTSVLAMLITGCALSSLSFGDVFGKWRVWLFTILKMLVFPIVFWFVMHFIITDRVILGVLTVIVSMPAGTNATIVSYQYGGDITLASAGVFLTTLVSVVSVPLIMNILF